MVNYLNERLIEITKSIVEKQFKEGSYFHARVLSEIKQNLVYKFKFSPMIGPLSGGKITRMNDGETYFFIDIELQIQGPKEKGLFKKAKKAKIEGRFSMTSPPDEKSYISEGMILGGPFSLEVTNDVPAEKVNFEDLINANIVKFSDVLIKKIIGSRFFN